MTTRPTLITDICTNSTRLAGPSVDILEYTGAGSHWNGIEIHGADCLKEDAVRAIIYCGNRCAVVAYGFNAQAVKPHVDNVGNRVTF